MARSRFRSHFITLALCLSLSFACAWKGHIKKGDAFMAANAYDDAAAEYTAALRARPDDTEIQAKLDAAQVGQIQTRATQARAALDAGQDGAAIGLAAEAYEILPTNPATVALIAEVVEVAGGRAKLQAEAGDFAGAMAIYDAILTRLPSSKAQVEGQAQAVVDAWIAQLDQAASEAEGRQHTASVLLYKAKISALSGADPSQNAELRQALAAQLRYTVHIKAKSKDSGSQTVAASLIGARPPSLLTVANEGQGAAATLSLSLSRPKYDTQKSAREASAQYQSGVTQVENPFYKMAQDDVLDEERRLLERENEVTKQEQYVDQYSAAVAKEGDTPGVSTGAEQNLWNAESRLESARRNLTDQRNTLMRAKEKAASTEQTKEEPVYSTHSYEIVTHTLRADSTLAVTLSHVDGRPALELNQGLTVSAQDDAHGAQNVAGINEDPLTLPSKDELALSMWSAALAPVDSIIVQSFSGYRQGLLDAAAAEASPEAKLELLLHHLMTDPTQAEGAILEQILELSGVPRAHELVILG